MSEAAQSSPGKSLPVKSSQAPEFLVSAAPHLSEGTTTPRIMFEVVAAMLPLVVMGIWLFGLAGIVLPVVTVGACLVTEAIANRMRGRDQASLRDGSAIVTGLILALSLPPSINPYMAAIGGAVAIALAKAVFGGIGQNLFNPAMVGRAFLMVCFPVAMTTWTEPTTHKTVGDVDAVTQATPLAAVAAAAKGGTATAAGQKLSMQQLFDGRVAGCLGETSALLALVGGLYLVFRRVADWRQPVGMLGAAMVFALIGHALAPGLVAHPLVHLNSGALMFGAFFIATDYVGAPLSSRGRLVFGIGAGLIVMTIRVFGGYPEGVMYAILIMNALTPLIERWTVPTPFGGKVPA